jgi:hypothetical protein
VKARTAARVAVVLGALAVLAVPVAVVAAQQVGHLTLLHALYYAVPVAIVLGLLAVVVARRGRIAASHSVFAARSGPHRAARVLAWLGVYAGVTAGLAIAVYWVLRARH